MSETTQEGVSAPADAEAQFQGLWDAGAFSADGKKPEENAAPQQQEQSQDRGPEIGADPKDQPAQEQQAQQPASEEYATLEEMLTKHQIDPESARELPVTVKIDGEERQVKLSDVLKSYQLEGHVNNKSIQLSEQQKAFEAERQAARQMVSNQLRQNAALGQVAMQHLNADYSRIDWSALRAQNPGQYAALQQDYQQRQAAIREYLTQVDVQQQQLAQEQQMRAQQALQAEHAKMLQWKPEWKDPATFDQARGQIMNYAKSIGYTDAELAQIGDHRLMRVLHDAASQAALQAAKPETLKRVREAPKMAKAGTRQNVDPKSAARQQAIERFNRNPRDIDAQAALFGVLSEG